MNVKFKRFLLLIILIQLQSYVEFLKIKNNCAIFSELFCSFTFLQYFCNHLSVYSLDTINYSNKD